MIALVIMCGESMLLASELSVIVIVPHSSHIKMVPQFPYFSIVISFFPLLSIDQFCPVVMDLSRFKWSG